VFTIKEYETGGTRTTDGRDEKCKQTCSLENVKGKNHLGVLGVYGTIILKWILSKQDARIWFEIN
jgi:hypothetical protein